MALRLLDVARWVSGTIDGDGHVSITGAAPLADVCAGQITFIDDPQKLERLADSPAAAALVPAGLDAGALTIPVVRVAEVHAAFGALYQRLYPPRVPRRLGISSQAWVSLSARVAEGVDIHPFATVGDEAELGPDCVIHSGAHIGAGCRLGAGVRVFPGAVLYENTVVGARSIIHAHAVIGSFGFGYKLVAGRHELAPQLGYVELGEDVEVGAGSTVDRGTFGRTLVGSGTKIDNQVQVAHNCRIGKHNLLCAQVGIAGSTSTGDYVVMAGQVGVRDHIHIGAGAVIGAMAGITNHVPDGMRMLGVPATPEREQKIKLGALSKLPEMRREFKALQAEVAELRARLGLDRPQAAA